MSALSSTTGRICGGPDGGHGLCRFLWLGLARTKNRLDALGLDGTALARCALALVWQLGIGLVGGELLGSMGIATSEFLVELCGCGRLDPC